MSTRSIFGKAGITLFFLLSISLLSCRDEELIETPNESDQETVSRRELTLDSIFLYAEQIYFWNEALPVYDAFNPRSYTSYAEDLENFQEELFDLTQYAINAETNEPYEFVSSSANYPKYSFIEENEAASSSLSYLSSSYIDGIGEDYGFALSAIAANDIRVRYVTTGSPAFEAGMRRGDILREVDGKSVRADSQSDIDLITSAFDEPEFNLTIEHSDGTFLETKLVKSTYTIDPVLKDTIFETSSGKIGYFAFDVFTALSNAQSSLDNVFDKLSKAGIANLIIDLRYNGGGYVETADYVINNIIPSGLNGKVMYTERFNTLMQAGKATILQNQIYKDAEGNPVEYRGRNATYYDLDYSEEGNTFSFGKLGSLETINNVYVIISEAAASASELVINTLKPYLSVTLIGSTSYGKPVGFFGIDIDKYTLYVPNFQTINSLGEGDYFQGLEPDYEAEDDVTHDFGDQKEICISVAVALATGSEVSNARTASRSAKTGFDAFQIGGAKKFNGMIENRKRETQ